MSSYESQRFLNKYPQFNCYWNEPVKPIHDKAEVIVKALVSSGMDEKQAYLTVNDFWKLGIRNGELEEAYHTARRNE